MIAWILVLVLNIIHCNARVFNYYSYGEILQKFKALASTYPEYVQCYSAQEKYQLQSPGDCGPDGPCQQQICCITNHTSLPNPSRPQVFFSGALHGDERVGPNTLTELAILLMNNIELYTTGSLSYNPWLLHLINTREIWLMPTTNSLGYYQNVRTENNIDPNRDFPYNSKVCMNTIAARAVNELWRENLFQISLTYHGGMQAISYEWGAFNHPVNINDESPDDAAQSQICHALSAYAGSFEGSAYPVGRLNDLVYPVDGGMEDWGYGSSWENDFSKNPVVTPCVQSNPNFPPYPASQTTYTEDMLRDFNILVETSDAKQPLATSLGSDAQILKSGGTGDGHLPRNIRLALLTADVVQPYLKWTSPSHLLTDAFVETTFPTEPAFVLTFKDGDTLANLQLSWEVAGAFHVDQTQIIWGEFPTYDQVKDQISQVSCKSGRGSGCSGLDPSWFKNVFITGSSPPVKNIPTRWTSDNQIQSDMSATPFFNQNSVCVTLDTTKQSTTPGQNYMDYFVVAKAQVDSGWLTQNQPSPAVPPQAHVVNARTNTNWMANNGGKTIKGQKDFYSWPIRVRVLKNNTATDSSGSSGAFYNNKSISNNGASLCLSNNFEYTPYTTYLIIAVSCAGIPSLIALLILLRRRNSSSYSNLRSMNYDGENTRGSNV